MQPIKQPIKPIKVTKKELSRAFEEYVKILKNVTEQTTEKQTVSQKNVGKSIIAIEQRVKEALTNRGWTEAEAEQIINRLKGSDNIAEINTIVKETIRKESEHIELNIPDEGLIIFRPNAFYPKEDVISVWQNGKRKLFRVHPDIAKVFKALDVESVNFLTKVFSIPAHTLRAGAVLSPEFIARNPIRDLFASFVYNVSGIYTPINTIKGLASALKKDQAYKDWVKSGGMLSEITALDRKYLQKNAGEILSKYPVLNRIRYGTKPLEMLRILTELSEQANRIGAFKKARSKGKTLSQAGFESREITLDFQRIGAKMRAVNSLIAFFNANIQGMDKLARSFKDTPVQTSAKIFAGITLPSVLLAISNHDDERYQNLPQWQKDLFWIIPTKDHIFRIPKPFELGIVFGSVPERFVHYLLEKDPEAFEGVWDAIRRGATPGTMPTFMIPLIENWANKSYFLDRPLIPAAREDLLPEYQYKAYTTEAAKGMAKLLGKLPQFKFDDNISPVKMENLIRGWSGGLGMHVLHLADYGLRKLGTLPDPVKPAKTLADIPFIKAFVVRYPSAGLKPINNFYKEYFKSKKVQNSFDFMIKQELNKVEATNIIGQMKEYMISADGIYKALNNITKTINLINENPNYTASEKRQLIDKSYLDMVKIAKSGNKIMRQIKKHIKENQR